MEDYEKKYKEALATAKDCLKDGTINSTAIDYISTIFPELAESEDEKFRRYILQCCEETIQAKDSGLELSMDTTKKLKNWLENQSGKDKLIKELGEYKDKYTLEVLEKHINSMNNKDEERLRKTTIAFLKDFAEQGYENAVECIDWLEKQGDKDKLIKELGEYKVKYTQEVLSQQLEKQDKIDKESYDIAEKEKYDFVSGHFIECRKSFDVFKEDNSYWFEYVGNDNYIGRSDNILNQKFHITPRQLYCLFTQEHCPKEDNANAPTEYGKYVDECLNDASEHFFSEGEDKYSVADLFYAGVRCGKSWFEKQGTSTKLSEEEQNSFSKGVLSNCALSFIDYLDAHKYEGKMCVSNGECEDIENAFHNAMWDRLHRYYCKYIEKQDEQKPILDFKASNWYVSKVDGKIHDMTYNPTDKVEPKFKVGDWVVTDINEIVQIKAVNNNDYTMDNGMYFNMPYVDNYCHLWTIQDAKDGDVLACGDKVTDCPFIFHNLTEELNPRSYCGVSLSCHFQDNDENGGFWCHSDKVRPATKEQRELLFKKMKEAGYTWDDEKKELKKIHVIDDGKAEMDYCFTKMMAGEKVSPAWSDEDEKMCQETIDWFEKKCFPYALESENPARESIKWLKSLKGRITWKPSKEQIEALDDALNERGFDYNYLNSLYEQLKKL